MCCGEVSRRPGRLLEGEVEVLDGLVDFGGAFVADGDCVDTGVIEGVVHGALAVFAGGECPFADQFHADKAEPFGVKLAGVGGDLRNVAETAGGEVLGVHFGSFVVDAHEGDFEPLVAGELAEGGEAVDAGAVADDSLFVFGFEKGVLPAE